MSNKIIPTRYSLDKKEPGRQGGIYLYNIMHGYLPSVPTALVAIGSDIKDYFKP